MSPSRLRGITPDEIRTLPELPGIYMFKGERGEVLYVGKAVNLNARVRQYFNKNGDGRYNVQWLMRHVRHIETIITANEKEALLLENTLIKKHQPRYNLRLRDDKTYVSVRINLSHEWPRAIVIRKRGGEFKEEKGALYLGPYASAAAVRDTLRQLQRIFPIRSCPDQVLRNRTRPCLLHQIGRCCAPCTRPVEKEAYREMVEGTILFLKGRTGEVAQRLRERMARHAGALEYEKAAVARDRLAAIEATLEEQSVHHHDGSSYDVVVLGREGGFGAFVVFLYRNGLLVGSRPFLVRDHDRPAEDLMSEFLGLYYENEPPPREVLVEPLPEGQEALEEFLGERREGKVEIVSPQRGERRRHVEVALENARQLLEQHLSGRKTVESILGEIRDKLALSAAPEVIECYDISTIQGFATVGSMVTFRGGEPDKTRYRRFLIRSLHGQQDDFAALHEMLTRRLRRVADGSESAPGLLVIDGGKGQLAVAVDVMEKLGLAGIPVVGMAKSRVKHRGEELYRTEERFFLPGRKNPVILKSGSPALHTLVRLRDETHRFGITYHRELRRRRNLRSVLESIPGVGKTRAAILLRHFGSLKKMKETPAEVIAAVPGIPAELAQRIYERLQAMAPELEKLEKEEAQEAAPEEGPGESLEATAGGDVGIEQSGVGAGAAVSESPESEEPPPEAIGPAGPEDDLALGENEGDAESRWT